jgi:uncharacterized protein
MTALITGATSGIGAAYAEKFAGLGYDLVLTGRNPEKLKNTGRALAKKYSIRVRNVFADFSDLKDVNRLVRFIRSRNDITVLVNNAGFGNLKPFGDDDLEQQTGMVLVHVLAPAKLVHAVLPQMKRNRKGVIINVSSMAGFAPSSVDALYCSTKAFLINFSESLYMGLKLYGIRVQALCPGFTRTEFHTRMGMKREDLKDKGVFKWMRPEDVVAASMKQLQRDAPVCIPGFWNRVLYYFIRILPRKLYYRIVEGRKAV